jgi:DNA polymerase-1
MIQPLIIFPPNSLNGVEGSCKECGLFQKAKSPCILPYGSGKKRIVIVGEAPGESEDACGKPWQGRAGNLLRRTLEGLGIDLFEDCISVNAVNCRPVGPSGDNRTPTRREIACCRGKVLSAIEKAKPKLILLLGACAVESVIGSSWKKDIGGMERWSGWKIPDRKMKAWICPTYHPSFVLRAKGPEVSNVWTKHLREALAKLEEPFPKFDDESKLIKIMDGLSWLETIPNDSIIAIDYETTGLKPWANGHRIVAVAIAVSPDQAFASLIAPITAENCSDSGYQKLLCNVLTNPNIRKIAHNLKYEERWSRTILGCEVKGWMWDTMLAAHILDNRPGIVGLKFQSYVNFGIADYDESVALFLQSDSKNSNSKNRVEQLLSSPERIRDLLTYCGMDALLTYRLFQIQKRQMLQNRSLLKAYWFFHDGLLALADMEQNGIRVDVEDCETKKRELANRIDQLSNEVRESEFGREWQRFIGPARFNVNSSDQLSKFLYQYKKIQPVKTTGSGRGSTDDEALRELGISELDKILEIRKLKKIREAYLDLYLREQVNGIIHPFFHLHTTRTFRSSSEAPNFQNIPKRDKELMQICRRALIPRPGNQFLSMDFSGIEVRIACVYTQDSKLIDDVIAGDMHRDMAIELFMLDSLDKHHPDESILRQAAKNSFVFPEFYGDYYANCARNLIKWATMAKLKDGTPALIHLKNKGLVKLGRKGELISFDNFIEHVRKVEDSFWNERYRQYTLWKDKIWRFYVRHGYIELLTGFRCSGLMDRKQVTNYPIQGTAFHCLLWVLIEFNKKLKQNKMKSMLVSQVHDELVVECPPDEVTWCARELKDLAEDKLVKNWSWINVPLKVEFELAGVNEPLSQKSFWENF